MRVSVLCFLLLGASRALAFSSPAQFDVAPSADSTGGSAGFTYTGSPRFIGLGCDTCHQGRTDEVDFRLTSDPPGLFGGHFTAMRTYHVQVDMGPDRVGADRCPGHPGEPCNLNGFAFEALSAEGTAGALCPVPFEGGECPAGIIGTSTVLSRDHGTIFASGLVLDESGAPGFRDGETRFEFYWRAPVTNAPVDFWVSAVDGDGAAAHPESASDRQNDPTGTVKVRVCGGDGCPSPAEGCATSPGASGASGWAVAALFAGLFVFGRRRRWLIALTAWLCLGGCSTVKPWQRGTLARSCMQFDADPQRALLEQHVFSYREGATGAYGGGGGGCGCN